MKNFEKKKQCSLVLELPVEYNELTFLENFKKFLLGYPEIQLTGTHIKKIEKRD